MLLPALIVGLAACRSDVDTGEPLPACPTPITESWTPLVEPEVRLAAPDAAWTASDGTALATDEDGSLRLAGPATAEARLTINRGTTYTITGTVTTSVPTTVRVLHHLDNDAVSELARQDFDGDGVLALSATPLENGDVIGVELAAGGEAEVRLSGLTVTGDHWQSVSSTPSAEAPLLLAFLIHLEDDQNFLNDDDKWLRRAEILAGFAGVLAAHGAKLTIQPDVTFVRGGTTWDPGWFVERAAEGVDWSLHLHDERDGAEAFEQAARDANRGFQDAGLTAHDLNGGFELGMWDTLADVGVRSITAYKDATTQLGLPTAATMPWRLAAEASTADPAAFTVHDPEGPVVYLPGNAVREADHARFADSATRMLSQVYAHTRPGFVNTWYFMFHVDGFGPGAGRAETDDYIDSGAFAADLERYDAFLTDVTDPLVAVDAMRYATADEQREAWLDWEAACAQ